MILGFRDRWLREFFLVDAPSRKIPPIIESRLFRKLQLLDDAMSDAICVYPRAIILRSYAGIWLDGAPYGSTISGG